MTLRIGILGGTFNPIHSGHILMAEGILVKLNLDYILFIPCAFPPHKRAPKLAPAGHRLKMVRLAIKNNSSFKISTVELVRGGKSFTVDTLCELQKFYGGKAKFFFVIGSDNLNGFCTWKDPNILIKLCKLIVVKRPGIQLKNKRIKGLKVINIPTLPVSSTDIRHLARNKGSIKYLVPENVRKYIVKHRLY